MLRYWLLVFTLFTSWTALAQTQRYYLSTGGSTGQRKAILIGHNVTPTTDIPPPGVWTVGTYAVGVSPTKNLFIASSPWIWSTYNTANIHVKWTDQISRNLHYSLFASYFESFNSTPFITEANGSTRPIGTNPFPGGGGRHFRRPSIAATANETVLQTNRYQWQSASLHLLTGYAFGDRASFYTNVHYGYFWNDDFPYSIRMDPGRDSIRGQIDVTTLTQIRLGSSAMHWLFELGGLGLNYEAPYLQVGTSLAYQGRTWLLQAGASATMQFSEAIYQSGWTPGRYDDREHWSKSENRSYWFRYLQTALHPEVQVQYYF